MIDKELELKDWILTTMLKCTRSDAYVEKAKILEEREVIRKKMYEGSS